jgi:hypothetical protein
MRKDSDLLHMPECGICGENVEKLFTCKKCGIKFCENDGSPEAKLCIKCSEKGIETLEAEHEDVREKEHEAVETVTEEDEIEEEEEEDRDENLDDYR